MHLHGAANVTPVLMKYPQLQDPAWKQAAFMGVVGGYTNQPSQTSTGLRLGCCIHIWDPESDLNTSLTPSQKKVICLLYFHTTAVCSRQQMAYNGIPATLSPTQEQS